MIRANSFPSLLAVATVLTFAFPALAQEAAEDGSSDNPARTIVVTADRGEREILDTPAAISLVTREEIEQQGAQSVVEALQGEPGVRISYYTEGNFPIIQVRSAGDGGQFQNTDVLLLIDGIPQVNLNDQVFYDQLAFEAVDRIEVVRGPTSALYGRNGVGGTINVITREAPDELTASATLTGGSFGFIEPRLTVGGPVADGVNFLVTGSYQSVDGWRDQTEREAVDLFAKLQADLGPNTDLTFSAIYFDLQQEVATIQPLLPDATPVPGIDVTDSFNIPGAESRNESLQIAATLTHSFNDTLSFQLPVYYRETDRILDNDGSFIDNINTVDQTFDLFPFSPTATEEIFGFRPQLTWEPSDTLQLIVGGDYEINNGTAGASNTFPAGTNFFTPITVNYATGEFLTDLNDLEVLTRRDGDFRSEVYAVFAQARVQITEQLGVTVGGRYDRQERRLEDQLRPNPLVEAEYDRFTPRIALDYAFTDDVTAYASYSEGFNPPFGGAFAFERAGADALEPEVARNYEVGVKANVADGRGFLGASAFILERRDLVQTLRLDGVNTQINAGGLDVFGLEFEGNFDLGGGFSANANYTYTDTEWQEFTIRGTRFAGFEVIQTPNHLGSVALDWQSADGKFELGTWIDYVGDRFATLDNTVELDSYTLVNAGAAYRPWGDNRLTLRIQGFNLLDEDYLLRTELDFGQNVLGGSPGRPASVLASINVQI
ncbi:TonB-dependent siderophore receptor [Erythrobacter sp. YT30]|uniref:TonB-dependent receptor n=1 Tax=Erythrobacter sp. YT30 TaxID=1735012 RepID=UPI00076C84DF|nr:TonB-dependent receptor [Erythrobacter sp. YT30]KWV92018.1 hypothetical protein AUC45_12755 [Erythrobacter sp. YT30]